MKYKKFFNNYTTYEKAEEKNKLKEIKDDIKAMLEEFVNYLEIRLAKEDEHYKQKFYEIIQNFPSYIEDRRKFNKRNKNNK